MLYPEIANNLERWRSIPFTLTTTPLSYFGLTMLGFCISILKITVCTIELSSVTSLPPDGAIVLVPIVFCCAEITIGKS